MARGDPVDVDSVLALPLVARVATNGPTIRPIWFLWRRPDLWWLTDTGSALVRRIASGDDEVAVVVDDCDLRTGETYAITLRGRATVEPLDRAIAEAKLAKYLGDDPTAWDAGIAASLDADTARLLRLTTSRITASDMSFTPS